MPLSLINNILEAYILAILSQNKLLLDESVFNRLIQLFQFLIAYQVEIDMKENRVKKIINQKFKNYVAWQIDREWWHALNCKDIQIETSRNETVKN